MRRILLAGVLALTSITSLIAQSNKAINKTDSVRQLVQQNLSEIFAHKTTLGKDSIEKFLVGQWTFKHLTNDSGQVLQSFTPTINGLPLNKPSDFSDETDIVFYSNATYKRMYGDSSLADKGNWYFLDDEKQVVLVFDEPKMPAFMDSSMVKAFPMLLKEEESFRIQYISENTLKLFSLYPTSNYEQWYNLKVYEKVIVE